MKKLLVSDLDGTLLGADKLLTKEIKDAVKKWQEAGNVFVIATGRLLASQEYYADSLNASEYMISCSGAVVYENKKAIREHRVPLEQVEKLWNIVKETGAYAQVYTGKGLVASRHGGIAERYEALSEKLPEDYFIPVFYSETFDDAFPRDVHKLSFTFETEEEAQEILSKMGDLSNVNYFKSLSYLYDIINKDSSKGLSAKFLCKKLGIPEDQTYVVGDNENDLSMFELFKNSAIMETAPKHLHSKASLVLPSAEKNGVVDFIEKILAENQ